MRIVSLVPSLTKTVCDFGLQKHIIGCTNFCVDPPNLYRTSARVGGTKDPDLNAIAELAPTHILVNEEENTASAIEFLKSRFNVLNTFPKSPADVPSLLTTMGDFLACPEVAKEIALELQQALADLKSPSQLVSQLGRKFSYLIWRDPWMAVAEDTYISKFLELMGMKNVVINPVRYPIIDPIELTALEPDVILMSSEPWPFRRRDAALWREITSGHSGSHTPKLYWIDGKAMSWYGTSTLEVLKSLGKIQQALTVNLEPES